MIAYLNAMGISQGASVKRAACLLIGKQVIDGTQWLLSTTDGGKGALEEIGNLYWQNDNWKSIKFITSTGRGNLLPSK